MGKNSETNIEIAKALGFMLYVPPKNSGSPKQWVYPKKYSRLSVGTPMTVIPDFVSIIDAMIQFMDEHHGIPLDYSTRRK